jgi:NAD(P)H-dependent FMN reductase
LTLIDLADVALPQVLGETPCPKAAATAARLDNAEAFVVVTPEYNHSFPAGRDKKAALNRARMQADVDLV